MARRGFTLIELMVVLTIILILAVVALPVISRTLESNRITDGARILQAGLVGARDRAVHDGDTRGIRLLPDPAILPPRLAANRYVEIERGPNYLEGRLTITTGNPATLAAGTTIYPSTLGALVPYPVPNATTGATEFYPTSTFQVIVAEESLFAGGGLAGSATFVTGTVASAIPNSPTSWYWNIRVGDQLRLNDSGVWYTVVGPYVTQNDQQFVNCGAPSTTPGTVGWSPLARQYQDSTLALTPVQHPEFLFLVNGRDDPPIDGFIDNGWDGINNDLSTGAFNNVDNVAEWETETVQNISPPGIINDVAYVIRRRPVPVKGSREVMLPAGTVIDLTNAATGPQERSVVPFSNQLALQKGSANPTSYYVDVLIEPTGETLVSTEFSGRSTAAAFPFYHFWITESKDVYEPVAQKGVPYTLPMPKGTIGYPNAADTHWNATFLSGERRLVTLFTRSGNIVSSDIQPATLLTAGTPPSYTPGFVADPKLAAPTLQPYIGTQLGIQDAK